MYDLSLLRIMPALILSIIMYWMVGLRARASDFFEFVLIAVLFAVAMALYNMLLAAVVEDVSVSILLGGLFILFNIGFGGFLLNLNELPSVFQVAPVDLSHEVRARGRGESRVERTPACRYRRRRLDHGQRIRLLGQPVRVQGRRILQDLLVLALGFVLGLFILLAGAVTWRMRERR